MGFVSWGRRSQGRAVRGMVRKGYSLQQKQLTPPREAVNSQNIFAAGDSCIALSERYYITSLFLLGVIFSSELCSCVHSDHTFQWPNDQLWFLTLGAQLVTQWR